MAAGRVVWAMPAGLLLGFGLGRAVGRLAIWLRSMHRDTSAPSDFLALALMALSYVGAETIGAWGFLATFAAGVGLRHAELHVTRETPHPEQVRNPAPPVRRSRDRGGVASAGRGPGRRERRGGGAARAGSRRGRAGGGDHLVRGYGRATG